MYEYSPFECLPIYAKFCLDLCHVVALRLLLMINICLIGPTGKVFIIGQSLNVGHI